MTESFTRTLAVVEPLVDAVTPAQLENPTPCPGWTVRTLIRHLAEVNAEFAAVAGGEPAPNGGVDPTRAGHGNPIAAFHRAARLAQTVFSEAGMPERTYRFPWGEEPGSKIVQHVIDELLIHSWDLARATGQSPAFPDDLVEQSFESWQAWFAKWPRSAGDNFGPELPALPDASPINRLAAFLGRTP